MQNKRYVSEFEDFLNTYQNGLKNEDIVEVELTNRQKFKDGSMKVIKFQYKNIKSIVCRGKDGEWTWEKVNSKLIVNDKELEEKGSFKGGE